MGKYPDIDTNWNGNARNGINKNFQDIDNDIKAVDTKATTASTNATSALNTANAASTAAADAKTLAQGADTKAADASTKADAAVATADEAKEIADRTESELSQAILAGDSSPLGGQLSVGADGTVYGSPQERLVAEKQSTDASLAQIAYQHGYVIDPKTLSDGTPDDQTDEIQFYIDKVKNSPMQTGVVFLSGKEYKITAALTMGSGITLKGAGRGNTALKGYGTGFAIIDGHGTADSPIYDFELSDMKIDAAGLVNPSYYTDNKCVYMTYLVRAIYKNLYVCNAPATGLGVDFLADSLIEGVVAEHNGWQLPEAGGVGANGIGIGTGFLDAGGKETLLIVNCHAINNGNSGIMFENQDYLGGYVYSGYAQVMNCISRGNKYGFRDSGNMRLKFVGNTALENKDGFILAPGLSDDTTKTVSKETILTNNHSYKNTRYGLYLYRLNSDGGFQITDNHFAENTQSGIYLGSVTSLNKSKIKNNFIYSNGEHGIYANGLVNYSDINDNHVYSNGLNGIYLAQGGKRIDVRHNKTFDNGLNNDTVNYDCDGIKVIANGNTFTDITIKENVSYDSRTAGSKTQRNGISLDLINTGAAISEVVIEDNIIKGNSNLALSMPSGGTNNTYKIENNKGYNPVGTSTVTVGVSPYTYTAGNTKETVYITGGTVSQIAKGGKNLFTSTNATVELEANGQVTITYSVVPTVNVFKQ